MQTSPRYSLIRRVLFPYSGKEALTRKQSLRVIAAWAILFTIPMVLCTLSVAVYVAAPLSKAAILLLAVILGGVVIFGLSAWAAIYTNNRAVRLRQQRNEAGESR
jgi:hypothetical protein